VALTDHEFWRIWCKDWEVVKMDDIVGQVRNVQSSMMSNWDKVEDWSLELTSKVQLQGM
jgi:hypothetical protein